MESISKALNMSKSFFNQDIGIMSSIRNELSRPKISDRVFSLKFLGHNKSRDTRETESNDQELKSDRSWEWDHSVSGKYRSHWILLGQWI